MAKRNARIHKPQVAITAGKRNKLIAFGVLISLILAGIMFAQGESFLATQKQPNSRRAGTGPAILTSFEATSPSKEYIYAGGKLVATEDCPVTLDKSSQSFASSSSSGSIGITINSSCSWAAVSNSSWITIISGTGTGNGTVSYSVAANSGSNARTGTITISDKTFTVLQGAFFADVDPNSPFFTFIGQLSARGITTGCAFNEQNQRIYCPSDSVTREQMAVFIIRARGEFNPPTPPTQRFADVPPTSPFYAFIDRMAALGITSGCGGGNYCPSSPVTREQMAAFIIKALGEFNPPTPPTQRFNDVPPSNIFYNFIDRMAVLGITNGCSASPPLYCPSDSVTRDQMAAFLVRAFHL